MNPSKCRSNLAADLVALDDALNRLAAIDPRKSKVVELRFFGGLTAEEAADGPEGFAAIRSCATGSWPRSGCTAN